MTEAEWVEAHLAHALFGARQDYPECVYPLLADQALDAGYPMCDRTAWKVCWRKAKG